MAIRRRRAMAREARAREDHQTPSLFLICLDVFLLLAIPCCSFFQFRSLGWHHTMPSALFLSAMARTQLLASDILHRACYPKKHQSSFVHPLGHSILLCLSALVNLVVSILAPARDHMVPTSNLDDPMTVCVLAILNAILLLGPAIQILHRITQPGHLANVFSTFVTVILLPLSAFSIFFAALPQLESASTCLDWDPWSAVSQIVIFLALAWRASQETSLVSNAGYGLQWHQSWRISHFALSASGQAMLLLTWMCCCS